MEKAKEDFVHKRVHSGDETEEMSFLFLGTNFGEQQVGSVDFLENTFLSGEGRLGYVVNKTVEFTPGFNSTTTIPSGTRPRDQNWRKDQRGSMLSEVSNYFENPVSYNMSVRQGGMQRRRGAASGVPRARLESVEHQHADNTG